MSAESTTNPQPVRALSSVRLDRPDNQERPAPFRVEALTEQPWRFLAIVAMAAGFVLFGGARLDPGPDEARLGLAAFERFGPLGQTFGGWEPRVWPGALLPSWLWAWGEGGTPTSASVRWPAAIAGALIGLVLARRASERLGGRAGLLVGAAWYGCVASMDRSAGAGLDIITGLATVGAIDRLLGKGSDLVAGAWLGLAFLCGGWPPVAVAALGTVVIGRQGATLSWRLLLPPALVAFGWSAWALTFMPAEAWGAALAAPLTERPAWWLIPGALALGLPWSPFALLAVFPSVRENWDAPGRSLVTGWLQIAGCSLLAGTLIPGLAVAAELPALAGLAFAAGAGLDRIMSGGAPAARRWAIFVTGALIAAWAVLAVLGGGYLAAAVPYYRPLAVGLMIATVPLLALTWRAIAGRDTRAAWLAVFALAVCLKAGHFGYYAPEWNYRRSQGPWGRAVGQWAPPGWPIYTVHAWPADLAFATGHPFRQLRSEWHLKYQPGDIKFVLLLQSEFDHWPENAPELVKVASFMDEHGGSRTLARTPGDLPWESAAKRRAPGGSPSDAD